MMTPCFPHASRRAFLRFEKQVYRALAELAESLAATWMLEFAIRAEADAELEELFCRDGLPRDEPHHHDGCQAPPRGPFAPRRGPLSAAPWPFGVDAVGPVSAGCGGCPRARGADGDKTRS